MKKIDGHARSFSCLHHDFVHCTFQAGMCRIDGIHQWVPTSGQTSHVWVYTLHIDFPFSNLIRTLSVHQHVWSDEKTSWILSCFLWLASAFVMLEHGCLNHIMRWYGLLIWLKPNLCTHWKKVLTFIYNYQSLVSILVTIIVNTWRLLSQKAVVYLHVDSKLWCHGDIVASWNTMLCAVLLIAGFRLHLHASHSLWHLNPTLAVLTEGCKEFQKYTYLINTHTYLKYLK